MSKIEQAKIVKTFDLNKNQNGYLMELTKNGKYTTSYMTVVNPFCFKGYHLHKIREANYTCIRGNVDIILYTVADGRKVYNLTQGSKLHIPANVPTGLYNPGLEEGWIINNPYPAYDPDLKDEQVDYNFSQLEKIFIKEHNNRA